MPSADAAEALAAAVERDLPGWVERCVRSRSSSAPLGDAPAAAASWAAGALRDLRGRTPLEVLRAAVRFPTEVLAAAGVPQVERDDFARERFPDDVYGLTPASFAEVSPEAGELALVWGAARVIEHKQAHS